MDIKGLFEFPPPVLDFTIDNYISIGQASRLDVWLKNTLLIAIIATSGVVIISVITGYALANNYTWLKKLLILFMLVSPITLIIPRYIILRRLFLGEHVTVALPMFLNILYILLVRGAIKQIPRDIQDAATIDGCGHFKYITKIIPHLIKPTILVIIIFTNIGVINDFLWQTLICRKNITLVIGVQRMMTEPGIFEDLTIPDWGLQMAGAVVLFLPALVIFMVFNRFFVGLNLRSGLD